MNLRSSVNVINWFYIWTEDQPLRVNMKNESKKKKTEQNRTENFDSKPLKKIARTDAKSNIKTVIHYQYGSVFISFINHVHSLNF